ncbi:MAG: glycosyl hydrolase family 98 [Bacteroidaceae bacterium]|nr:glycosyl hydrolase family 98 [Bacteroidaceae bacterium]
MKKIFTSVIMAVMFLMASLTVSAQERRPIDSEHPLWMIHIDVWNSADPQKIIDLIPDDIKPYVCMNLSLSCQFDAWKNDKDHSEGPGTQMYRMPRCAVRTYKSWASVCQANGMWFTCQPASGGHTHIQDDDLETFEYFFKAYPNFLGWNYAEQFWGFDEAGDMSSSTQASRIALFAKLVPMHHQYGGVLTVSFCGNIWSHPLNPIGMLKKNSKLMAACKEYPEAILWLYKYTTSSCFYNNESVTFGPFIAGLAKNYGVRYDNCGWNGALEGILGKNHGKTYPGAAGIGTVMEQTCVNGGAVWDGPELIWTEDFKNLDDSKDSEDYIQRNWGIFPNFRGVWLDMWRKIIDGTLYIPTREEVVKKTKIVVINNLTSGSDEDKYAAWGDLYDGLYKQTDPFNKGNGQWMDNYCYFKKTGRYGAIPIVPVLYDDLAKSIQKKVYKSSKWSSLTTKVNDFNKLYPEVSTGDLYVNRYRNQLVTYTPYTYMNKNKTASAVIPLQYNTCESLELTWGKLSSGHIREYSDHIDFYLNNFRADTTTMQTDKIVVKGVTKQPSYTLKKHPNNNAGTTTYSVFVTPTYDAEAQTYTVQVRHCAPLDITINCEGDATERNTDVLPSEPLATPKQPDDFEGPIIIEAENMDRKDVGGISLTHSGWWASDMNEFAGLGYITLGSKTTASLRHRLKLKKGGEYNIYVRYCNSSKAGNIRVKVNDDSKVMAIEKVSKNDWHKAKITTTLKAGTNLLTLTNTGGVNMIIDQIIYSPVNSTPEKYLVTVRSAQNGKVEPVENEVEEGKTVTLNVKPDEGYKLTQLRVVNSVYYTMSKTIAVNPDAGNTITFTMPDDNVTIMPVFKDATAVYYLDFTGVNNGAMAPGWRCVQEDDAVHEYPNTFDRGARVMTGFSGYQKAAIYWRKQRAEYGRQTAYPLNLEPGEYKLSFACAAWKGTPKYKVEILNKSTGSVIAASTTYSATPNVNGSQSASIAATKKYELPFTIDQKANYVIRFSNMTGGSDLDEFLLAECRISIVETSTGIELVEDFSNESHPIGIYNTSGVMMERMQPGINIVRDAKGKTRKVYVK